MNNLTQYQLALEIVNATKEQLEEWCQYIEIEYCYTEDMVESWEEYHWSSDTPNHLLDLNAYDVITEYWRR